jgi:molecular chaperone DnaK
MIELKNEADSIIYQTEKQLTEHKDKLTQNIVDQVKNDISEVTTAMSSEDAQL